MLWDIALHIFALFGFVGSLALIFLAFMFKVVSHDNTAISPIYRSKR